jgi:hypothetical protein
MQEGKMKHKKVAHKIINFFDQRSGFDAWWCEIDPDIREEIIEELAELLKKAS